MHKDEDRSAPAGDSEEIESSGVVDEAQTETGAEGEAPSSPEEMGRLLEDARAKADEHWDTVLRTRAEMENLKRRAQRDVENAHKYALDKFVGELVGVWDSLELGQKAASAEDADIEKLREGVDLTLKQLSTVMEKFGVEQIDPTGQPFDPDMHQAISMVPTGDVPPNTVVDVIQKGYTLNGRLIRPALVVVSQAT